MCSTMWHFSFKRRKKRSTYTQIVIVQICLCAQCVSFVQMSVRVSVTWALDINAQQNSESVSHLIVLLYSFTYYFTFYTFCLVFSCVFFYLKRLKLKMSYTWNLHSRLFFTVIVISLSTSSGFTVKYIHTITGLR